MRQKFKKTKLWGGRFSQKTADAIERFTHSLDVDERLAPFDLAGSIAHATMLGKCRIIPKRDAAQIVQALKELLSAQSQGRLKLDRSAEDIHTAIQWALEKKIGKTAGRLHSARSRNDQVATAFRLYCKNSLKDLEGQLKELQKQILSEASKARGLIMPGTTHLRHAQPILVAHLLLSYLPMLERDQKRLQDAFGRLDELPLGSGALAGTSLPINRQSVAKQLGFARVCENSIDGVNDRDFVVEILSSLSLLAVHLSRIAEDLILWSTSEYGFLSFQENLLTGSSMMPQKQNPDFLELTRGGTSQVVGALMASLTLLKGLSTGYQRDLQLDKVTLFGAEDQINGMLEVLTLGVQGLRWNKQALAKQTADESLYATDLADFLVQKGVSFAQAHQAIGKLLTSADKKGRALADLPLSDFQRFASEFDQTVFKLLDPQTSVNRKQSSGSTHPQQVALAIQRWKKQLR